MRVVPGTFDVNDLVVYFVAGFLAIYFFGENNEAFH
jgi:hypothetical protein